MLPVEHHAKHPWPACAKQLHHQHCGQPKNEMDVQADLSQEPVGAAGMNVWSLIFMPGCDDAFA
jgi:hypothetical protein